MRIPKPEEDLRGKICVCSVGRVGIVTGCRQRTFQGPGESEPWTGFVWEGLGLDGKGTWASEKPCVVAESGEEFHDKLLERFGGKMSYNG